VRFPRKGCAVLYRSGVVVTQPSWSDQGLLGACGVFGLERGFFFREFLLRFGEFGRFEV